MIKSGLLTSLFILLLLPAQLYAGPSTETLNCTRLVKSKTGTTESEVKITCEEVFQFIVPPLHQVPDVVRLANSNKAEASQILGEPFHSYFFEQEEIVFYQQNTPISISYNKSTGAATKIIMDLIGLEDINEMPSFLSLENNSTPRPGPVGLFWDDLGIFKQIEVHYPDFKLNGQAIYTVILHINPN